MTQLLGFLDFPCEHFFLNPGLLFEAYIAFSMFAALHLVELNTMFLSTPEVSGLVRQQ